jgi:beta-lactamase class A
MLRRVSVLSRRSWLAHAAAAVPTLRLLAETPHVAGPGLGIEEGLAAIEARAGGRLGVAILDTSSGMHHSRRSSERFPMCSTFKLLAVAGVLARVDAGRESLGRTIAYGEADLLEYAPVTRAHVGDGAMSLEALCAAAIEQSDNTAGNLLLALLGGPPGLTSYVRSLGDTVTRLDRDEPTLNASVPGDERDTTTPLAMLGCLRKLLVETEALSPASRARLAAWLVGSTRGTARIRAGLPAGWRAGSKAGTGGNGATNDVAIAWPPGSGPVLIAAYLAEATVDAARREAALAGVGRLAGTMLERLSRRT